MVNPKRVEVTPPRLKFYHSDGVTPLAGGQVFVYAAGTTNKVASWADAAGTIANPNPVILDSAGECSIWIAPAPGTPVPAGMSVTDFGAVGDGITDDTVAIRNALLAGPSIYLPSGTYLTDTLVLPPTLRQLYAYGGATLKFKRRVYLPFETLIATPFNTDGLVLSNFAIDVDDPLFATTRTIRMRDSRNVTLDLLSITGCGDTGVYLVRCTNVVLSRFDFIGTGTGFQVGATSFDTARDLVASTTRHSGPHNYGIVWAGGEGNCISQCRSEGAAIFGFCLDSTLYGAIDNCFAKDSGHEAFQLTNSSYCTISNCRGEWTTGGIDFGISINGIGAGSRFNRIMNNVVVNSHDDGIAIADASSFNVASNNSLFDCAVRATAATPAAASSIACYTMFASQCVHNTFESNLIVNESGPVTFGYFEINTSTGTTDFNIVKGNRFSGPLTKRYEVVGAATEIFDDTWQDWTPAVTSSAGAITAHVVNSAQYRVQGKLVAVKLDVTITSNGTGAVRIDITLPFAAAINGGTLGGRQTVAGSRQIVAVASGPAAACVAFDGTYPAVTGSRLVLSGTYGTT